MEILEPGRRENLGMRTPRRGQWVDGYPQFKVVRDHDRCIRCLACVRQCPWDCTYYDPEIDAWELYDLERDPNELKNVYADPSYADALADLMVDLATARAQYGIDAEMDLAFYEESRSGVWGRELREFLNAQREGFEKE